MRVMIGDNRLPIMIADRFGPSLDETPNRICIL